MTGIVMIIFHLGVWLGLLLFFTYLYLGGRKKDQLEDGIVALFREQCGGRFDSFNLTIPFVRHAMYDEFIVIGYYKERYVINYTDLTTVSLKRFAFSKGIIYSHNRQDLPNNIIIWSRSPDRVIEFLKYKNVEIKE